MKNLVVGLALIIGLVIVIATVDTETSSNGQSNVAYATPKPHQTERINSVTLQAAPGNSIVQMFGSISDEQAQVIQTFPDGTRCTKISGPVTSPLPGPTMRFYRLTCNNVTGYINEQWVR